MIFKWIGLLISYTFYDIKFVYQVFIYIYQIRRSFKRLIKILLFIYLFLNMRYRFVLEIMSNLIHYIGVEVNLKKKKNIHGRPF